MEITPPCVLWDEKLLRVILAITPPCVSWSNFTPHHLGKLLRLCGSLMGSIRHRKVGGGVGRLVGVRGVGTRLGGRQETGRLAEAWTTGKVFPYSGAVLWLTYGKHPPQKVSRITGS